MRRWIATIWIEDRTVCRMATASLPLMIGSSRTETSYGSAKSYVRISFFRHKWIRLTLLHDKDGSDFGGLKSSDRKITNDPLKQSSRAWSCVEFREDLKRFNLKDCVFRRPQRDPTATAQTTAAVDRSCDCGRGSLCCGSLSQDSSDGGSSTYRSGRIRSTRADGTGERSARASRTG